MNPSLDFEIYLDLKIQYLDIIYQYLCCIFYHVHSRTFFHFIKNFLTRNLIDKQNHIS